MNHLALHWLRGKNQVIMTESHWTVSEYNLPQEAERLLHS